MQNAHQISVHQTPSHHGRREFLVMSLSMAPVLGVLVGHSCEKEDCVLCQAKTRLTLRQQQNG